MSGIICAIRGGLASRTTINKAVELAGEHNLPLYFLYVLNLDFLAHTASSRVRTITDEMYQMGNFILLVAQEKALELGVEAEGVIRKGNVGEEIIYLCREIRADYVILGQPKGKEEQDIFTRERLLEFGQQIERESGADVILVEGDDSA
jgi:nucleotide-binding universal stress UspA family protein